MHHESIQKKIIKHLDGLHELEKQTSAENLIQTLAERYETSEEVVKKALADWQAGKIENYD